MIVLVGDLHVRKEEPFYQAVNSVFDTLYNLTKEGDTIIQVGDFFHSYKPFPKEYDLAFSWLRCLSDGGRKIIILAGNNAHEYHHQQKSYAIQPLESIENVQLVLDPEVLTVEGIKFLCLPWLPYSSIKLNYGKESLEEAVFSYIENLEEETINYVLYHFEDETVFMGGANTGVDLSVLEKKYPNIKRVGGHIHLRNKNYIGTPYQTRADEIGQTGVCYIIEDGVQREKEFKQYITYMNVDYSDDVPDKSFGDNSIILNIKGAPSVDDAYEKFRAPHIHINSVSLMFKTSEVGENSMEVKGGASISQMLNEFLQVNKIDKKVSDYLKGLF